MFSNIITYKLNAFYLYRFFDKFNKSFLFIYKSDLLSKKEFVTNIAKGIFDFFKIG